MDPIGQVGSEGWPGDPERGFKGVRNRFKSPPRDSRSDPAGPPAVGPDRLSLTRPAGHPPIRRNGSRGHPDRPGHPPPALPGGRPASLRE